MVSPPSTTSARSEGFFSWSSLPGAIQLATALGSTTLHTRGMERKTSALLAYPGAEPTPVVVGTIDNFWRTPASTMLPVKDQPGSGGPWQNKPVPGPALGPTYYLPILRELQPNTSSPVEGQKQQKPAGV